jgi:N-acetylglucosamine-6-sulfatase
MLLIMLTKPKISMRCTNPRSIVRILAVLILIVLVPMTADASGRHARRAANEDSAEVRALTQGLELALWCQRARILVGPARDCPAPKIPARYAELGESLLALALGQNAALQIPIPRRVHRRQLRCQRAIGAVLVEEARQALNGPTPAPRGTTGRRRRPAPKSASAFGDRLERVCDIPVHEVAPGVLLPTVGPQCAAAMADEGEPVDAAALRRCLEQLARTWAARSGAPGGPPRPNVVVIVTDDQRFDTLDATHSPDNAPVMPAVMSRLADEGVTFTRAYVPTSVCSPSRASILSGWYARNHFQRHNGGGHGPVLFRDESTLATWLRDAGYRTAFVGKYMNHYGRLWEHGVEAPYIPPGWDEWYAFADVYGIAHYGFNLVENGEIVSYPEDSQLYSTDVLAGHAQAFVETAAQAEEPFLLVVKTAVPHYPWTAPPRHEGAFSALPIWIPPSYFEEDISDKPAWVSLLRPLDYPYHLGLQYRRRTELEMLLSVDEFVESLMDQLEALEIADDTMVIYTSDNGMGWGEHRYTVKGCPYEECVRVPMIVRYPRLAPLPRVEDRIVANIDIAPTLVDLAGAPMPPRRDGQSMARVIDATTTEWRRGVMLEYFNFFGSDYTGVVTDDWKYVHYTSGERELYDRVNDPYELENRAGQPDFSDIQAELEAHRLELIEAAKHR